MICDPDTYICYSFFGEPGSLNDLNILEKSTIVGSILNGMMELHLPQELHYSINGTVQGSGLFIFPCQWHLPQVANIHFNCFQCNSRIKRQDVCNTPRGSEEGH